jgi:ubiquitin carboxyl-terminal hydrolase 9/24
VWQTGVLTVHHIMPPPTASMGGAGEAKDADPEPELFPAAEYAQVCRTHGGRRMNEFKINVNADGPLCACLKAAISILEEGDPKGLENAQFKEFLNISLELCFLKLLRANAVLNWGEDIIRNVTDRVKQAIVVAALALKHDFPAPMVMLAYAFDPASKFHKRSNLRDRPANPGKTFATARPDGLLSWLVMLVNHFGAHNGFGELKKRIERGELTTPVLTNLVKPWGGCFEFLTDRTMQTYITPLIRTAVQFLSGLEGDALKRETKLIAKSNCLYGLVDVLRDSRHYVGGAVQIQPKLHLDMLLKMINGDTVDGVMYSLNDLKRTIQQISPWKHNKKAAKVDPTWITNESLSAWLVKEDVLTTLFKSNLHLAQYVEKLTDIVRFMISTKSLTHDHLSMIWEAQIGEGKHQSIINNVRDLLAQSAKFLDTDELDQMFHFFQQSWGGSVQQMRGLIDFIRRLAEDDSEGVVATKVLDLLWDVSHSDAAPQEIIDVARRAHSTIINYSYLEAKDKHRFKWIKACVEDLSKDVLVCDTLAHLKELIDHYGYSAQ